MIIQVGWKKVGEASNVIKWIIKWMGVQAEFILVPTTDLERFLFIFVLSNKTGTKTDLSGNIQRSWREDFWIGYTWTWHQLGNLVSKWSWKVRTKRSFATA